VNQMSRDGETSPRLGEKFRLRACILLKNLGYAERVDRRLGIDFGADPPARRRNLLRPPFSPVGKTAFEFKSGVRVPLLVEVSKLGEKIERLNTSSNPEFASIAGGVIITDSKASNTDIARALEHHVNCWDVRYAHLLAKKVEIFRTLTRLGKTPKERLLDEWTTYFTSFGAYSGFIELKAHLFYHNPLQEMNAERVEAILNRFANVTRTLTSRLELPIVIHLKLHSASEVTEGAEDRFRELTPPQRGAVLRYESQACFIISYSSAPWFVHCVDTP
jgi:hypothetical protein